MSVNMRLFFASFMRWKLLTAVSLLTVVIAFFLFGMLLALDRVFNAGVKVDKADRLIVANAITLMQPLPLAYEARLASQEGVSAVSRTVFFGGFYQDPTQGLMAIVTEPRAFLDVLHEIVFTNAHDRERWLEDPATIAVGRALADKYGWQVGDLVPLYSYLYPRRSGGVNWTFRVAAIYDTSAEAGNTNSLLIHYAYFDAERANAKHTVGWYTVKLKDARQADRIAQEIDAMFANSPYETRTASDAVFAQELIKQVGDFSLIVRLAILAVLFTLILVVANSMIHAVNERVREIATMKALGSSDLSTAAWVLAEGTALIGAGAVLGALIAFKVMPMIAAYSVTLSSLHFDWHDLGWMALAVVGVAALVSLAPARQAWFVDTAVDLGRAA